MSHDCARCTATKIENLRLKRAVKLLNKELREARSTDPMTGLASKNKMYQAIDHHLALRSREHAGQSSRPEISLIFIDLDDFKRVNDANHVLGDELLMEFADVLRTTARAGDVIARFGGDEFCILAPNTNKESAEGFCEKIQAVLEGYTSSHMEGYRFQASLEVASTSEGFLVARDLVSVADRRMAEQKYAKKLTRK